MEDQRKEGIEEESEKTKETREGFGDRSSIPPNLRLVMDVPFRITVELGRTKMPLVELLKLKEGSIVELPTAVGDLLDVLVNGKPIAKGEVVVVNDRYAVRIISIISEEERFTKISSEEP